jgi:DNA-binding CsgD family transcriptional regulator
MSRSAALRTSDLRAIFHLVGECRELGDDPARWRLHFARGLGGLVGAELAQVGDGWLTPAGGADGQFIVWGIENGFDSSALRCLFTELARSAAYNPLFLPYRAVQNRENGACRSRADLVPDSAWYRSAYFEYHRAAGADAEIYCNWRQPSGVESVVAIGRPFGERDFTSRQKGIVRETHALIAPLIGGPLAGFGEPSPADLPPRVRQVLRCLLEGDSDKQMMARLGLSRHTVNGYAKSVFTHFRVRSRAELLARWVRRGWGGRFAWAEEPEREDLVGPLLLPQILLEIRGAGV